MKPASSISFIFIVMILILFSESVSAECNQGLTISIQKSPLKDHIPDIDCDGTRSLGEPITCLLNKYGLSFSDQTSSEDIILYEIRSESDGLLLACFYQEEDFIEYFFSYLNDKNIFLVFKTLEYQFYGYVTKNNF